MKHFLMWFVFIGITAIMFFAFIGVVLSTTDAVTTNPPFLTDVKEIAASENYVYTLDPTFNKICKYDKDGNFIICISFGKMGNSRIFCNSEGNLCRYSVRGDIVFVYGDDGNIIETYKETSKELIDTGILESYNHSKTASVGETIYRLENHLIAPSRVTIGQRSFVVESVGYHIFNIFYILIAVGCALFAVANLLIYIHQTYKNDNAGFMSNKR